jgi:glucose-like phosphotransferase system IIB component
MELHTIIQYIIIIVVLLLISLVIIKLSKKDFGIEINKLVQYLGGKDNILDTEVNMSRFKVTLKDVSIVDKEGIQKLGAKGIVEIDNQLKIIFGNDSRTLKRYVEELKRL